MKTYRQTGSLGSTREMEIASQELLYVLKDLQIPETIGEMRTAQLSEYPLLQNWFLAFAEEAGILVHDVDASIQDGLDRGSFLWWIVNGEIVSLAVHAPIVTVPGGTIARGLCS